MTRINVGIKPQELPDKLLLAEHREMKRVPNTITSGRAKVRNIPNQFTLGPGHVKFFYDKLGYLYDRYKNVYDECVKRGFNITPYHSAFDNVPYKGLFKKYKPTARDRQIIVDRIESRGHKLKKV